MPAGRCLTLLPYAIRAMQQGFHIFPVEPGGKTPHKIRPDKPWTIKWSEVATDRLETILSYWQWSPNANIGIAAKQSGLLIVDCDMPKKPHQLRDTRYRHLHDQWGPMVDGTDVLREVCDEYGGNWDEIQDTYRVCTGSMGVHLYYRWPPEVKASQASIVKGMVDIRCNGGERGGYVLGAGSVTDRGSYVAENAAPIRDAPRWLIELCREPPARPIPPFAHPRRLGAGGISGLVETVRTAPDGNLNNALLWAARAACSSGIPMEEAVNALAAAYTASHGRGGHRQAEATIRSGYRLQERKGG